MSLAEFQGLTSWQKQMHCSTVEVWSNVLDIQDWTTGNTLSYDSTGMKDVLKWHQP
jgi:hypothetical protein